MDLWWFSFFTKNLFSVCTFCGMGCQCCDSFSFLSQWIELFWYCLQGVCQNAWPFHNNPRWVFFIFIFLRIYNYLTVCLVARSWQQPWHKLGMLASWIKNYVSIASSAWSLEKIGTQTLENHLIFSLPPITHYYFGVDETTKTFCYTHVW